MVGDHMGILGAVVFVLVRYTTVTYCYLLLRYLLLLTAAYFSFISLTYLFLTLFFKPVLGLQVTYCQWPQWPGWPQRPFCTLYTTVQKPALKLPCCDSVAEGLVAAAEAIVHSPYRVL